ncbi:Crp/FNR family transcriptional regulator [Xylaria bambusicola]|uniref:Crp/FNR family transcriptional regulator n=1 Tax=Xylaria bambusicola TaxID=326684 RepID=UPI00200831E0|nr:Crp/FNR family transcriptional regulator [Xylaria bambusicola]KAI0517470.1 Crp/FNR family transcriptional regulator [Xylaria bambusicola]
MGSPEKFDIFVFSKTVGYRHDSIPAGIEGLRNLGASTNSFNVTASEDSSLVNATFLSRFKVVVFLSTSGEFLTSEELQGLKTFVNNGGGFVGIHCAAAGMYGEPWYGELVGAYFADHPEPQHGVVRVENKDHVIVSGYPEESKWFDEWYNFKSNPRDKVTVLLSTDESLYQGGTMGSDHPLAWCREFDGGRTFYTALGHFDEAYRDQAFLTHLLNGILWAARVV